MVRGVHTRRTVIRYTVVLEQESDGGYNASVPALAGCVSQGDSRAEALANIREAIELYVGDCRDAGDPVPTEVSPHRRRRRHDRRSIHTTAQTLRLRTNVRIREHPLGP